MAIHKEFAEWYRPASVTPSAELLEARWKSVEAIAAALEDSQLVALLRLHAIRPIAGYKAPEFLDDVFRSNDITFRGDVAELRVLAGAILRQVIETDGRLATSASLGLVSSSFGSRLENVAVYDHVRAASEYLAHKSDSVRKVGAEPRPAAKSIGKGRYDELLPTTTFGANQTAGLREPLISTFNEHGALWSGELASVTSALWHAIQVQREELNMLWWLQTKVSRDLNVSFSELDDQATVLLSKELADLTVFLPGPAATVGLIASSLAITKLGHQQATIVSAVNRVSRKWREAQGSDMDARVGDLCPISLAIVRSLDTDGEVDWLPVYRKQCDVRIEEKVDALEIANQFYIERLFSRSLQGRLK